METTKINKKEELTNFFANATIEELAAFEKMVSSQYAEMEFVRLLKLETRT